MAEHRAKPGIYACQWSQPCHAGGRPCGLRGFGVAEFQHVGELIVEVLDALSAKGAEADEAAEASVRAKVKALLARFPIYPD